MNANLDTERHLLKIHPAPRTAPAGDHVTPVRTARALRGRHFRATTSSTSISLTHVTGGGISGVDNGDARSRSKWPGTEAPSTALHPD